jgi:phosphoserine phosphatase RsbU/P
LQRRLADDPASNAVSVQIESTIGRMSALIENVLDFARGQLGGGLPLTRVNGGLGPTINQVLDEMRATFPDRRFECDIHLDTPVDCDPVKIAQVLSNLLGNAVIHGAKDAPIGVQAATREGVFTLRVSNRGEAIPAAAHAHLFQPFYRAQIRPDSKGLGLGLYIAAEIAKAHGGQLGFTSTDKETRFTLTMPTGQVA